ncbi:35065_t:CDS:2 [Racocetra persica]|uniref:35065_t:CDS:1 n=1 Tax=Racocetra persica TaxID=160502 RepID=A0ACA9L1R8_9GLOM|nr:35065_t:CDS:2 [Racocetra persica]
MISKLSDKSQYTFKTAHAIVTYIEIVDKPITTKDVLNDEEIIAIVQAKENKEPISKDKNEDGVLNLPVSAAEVCNMMQIFIHYEEQENADLYLHDPYPQKSYFQDYFQDYSQDYS